MSDLTASSFPGPAVLGRGAVVAGGAPTPDALDEPRRVRIDDDVLRRPHAAAAVLHRDLMARRPVVVELATDNRELRAEQHTDAAPWEVGEDFAFDRDRLHVLTWANTYDLRSVDLRSGDQPVWWHGVLARRAGLERPGPDQPGDARMPDGTPVWCDGGPRGPVPGVGEALVHRESVQLARRDGGRPATRTAGDGQPADHLAPDQRTAVTHRSGPARVIAPAGSGKTRVLTARLRHLLGDRSWEPELVTAVAYNTRAAAEMRARASDLPGGTGTIRTLHSLALWICTLDRRRRVIEEREARDIIGRLVRTPRIPNRDPVQPYLEALSEVRLGLRDPAQVQEERDDVPELAEAFERYRGVLDRRDLLDFDEQVYQALELLLRRPDVRATAQQACTHLLVDEFQDLTPAFLLLIRLVAAPAWQVFGVGDDDQVIYGWAGATPRYLVDYDRFFPGATRHALEVNYRCPPPVVGAAARLLSHNRLRVDKTIRAARDAPPVAPAPGPGSAGE